MRIRVAVVVGLLLASRTATAAAQGTGDQARLVFSISGAFIGSKGLWNVPDQRVAIDEFPTHLAISRSTTSTFGASLGSTYYPKGAWGLTAEAFLLGLGYDDACRVTGPSEVSLRVMEVCEDITQQEKSAAAASLAVGTVLRLASREFISPFLRAGVGVLFTNQSSILTQGVSISNGGALLIIYVDDARSRVRPTFQLGVGATMVLSRGYHLRWEVRDNIVGVEEITSSVQNIGSIPPHETNLEHVWSVQIGLDVILERQRGRRY
jgi:hypothetical protein